MELDKLELFVHGMAEPLRQVNPDAADSLHWLGSRVQELNTSKIIPMFIRCEECGRPAAIFEPLCPSSEDFKEGQRALYRCSNTKCGEIYIR